jgi:hypothetical protein
VALVVNFVNCRVMANFRHKKTARGGLIKYAVIFYICPGIFIVYAVKVNKYEKGSIKSLKGFSVLPLNIKVTPITV